MAQKFSSKGIVIPVAIFLLATSVVAASLLAGSGQSQPSYTADDFFVNLIENKADLTGGTAVFEIRNPMPTDLMIDTDKFNIRLENQPGATPIQSIKYSVLENVSYSQNVTDYTDWAWNETVTDGNGTYNITKYSRNTTGWHWSNSTNEEWKELAGRTLKSGATHRVKIEVAWLPKIGFNSREWIPKMIVSGTPYEQTRWAWWNTSWRRSMQVNVSENNYVNRILEPMDVFVNPATKPINATNEIRVTECSNQNSTICNETETPSQVWNKTTSSGVDQSFNVIFQANVSKSSWRVYTVYYNNSGAAYPNYNPDSSLLMNSTEIANSKLRFVLNSWKSAFSEVYVKDYSPSTDLCTPYATYWNDCMSTNVYNVTNWWTGDSAALNPPNVVWSLTTVYDGAVCKKFRASGNVGTNSVFTVNETFSLCSNSPVLYKNIWLNFGSANNGIGVVHHNLMRFGTAQNGSIYNSSDNVIYNSTSTMDNNLEGNGSIGFFTTNYYAVMPFVNFSILPNTSAHGQQYIEIGGNNQFIVARDSYDFGGGTKNYPSGWFGDWNYPIKFGTNSAEGESEMRNFYYASKYPLSYSIGSEDGNLSEALARIAIVDGINQALGSSALTYTDQQIYVRYANNTQKLGRFDKVTRFGSQIWAFNYITSGETFTNMSSIGTAFNVLEMTNTSSSVIANNVRDFILQTKTS